MKTLQRQHKAPDSRSHTGDAALTPRSLPEPRGIARPRNDNDADGQPTWKPFNREDKSTEGGTDQDLLTDDWASDWDQSYKDEFHFCDNLTSRKSPPDAEHLVSDDHYVMTASGKQTVVEVEFEMPAFMAKLVTDVGMDDVRDIGDDSLVAFKMNKQRKLEPVIDKEADELTADDIKRHQAEVDKAIIKELTSWIELGALQQRLRKGCTNLMTARWVIRWKRMADGTPVIKARLCIRGFQDLQQDSLRTYSATASQQGQRLVNFIAANRRDFVGFS